MLTAGPRQLSMTLSSGRPHADCMALLKEHHAVVLRYYIKNEVGVRLIRHVDRHLDSAIAAGIMIDSCATHDCPRDSLAPTKESGIVEQTLGCDLSTIKHEGGGAEDIASSGSVPTERGALACGVPDFPSSRMIEQIA